MNNKNNIKQMISTAILLSCFSACTQETSDVSQETDIIPYILLSPITENVDLDALEEAANIIEENAGCKLFQVIEYSENNKEYHDLYYDFIDFEVTKPETFAPKELGVYTANHIRIKEGSQKAFIYAHEIGHHLLGYAHDESEPNYMNAFLYNSKEQNVFLPEQIEILKSYCNPSD